MAASPLEQQGASRKGVGRWRHTQQNQASIGLHTASRMRQSNIDHSSPVRQMLTTHFQCPNHKQTH